MVICNTFASIYRMIRSAISVLRTPFKGLAFAFFCIGIACGVNYNNVAEAHSTDVVNLHIDILVNTTNLFADYNANDDFGKRSPQFPASEEENETKTEKEDTLGLDIVFNTHLILYTVDETPFEISSNSELDNLHAEPLYVLHHSWKTHLS